MPRRRPRSSSPSTPPPHTQARAGGGLLSGVLSFVSREFESFVASATGTSSAAGDLRRNRDKDDNDVEEYSDDEEEDEDERRRRRRRRDRSPPRKRTRHARSHSRKRTPLPDTPPRKHRSASRSHKRRRRRSPPTESEQDSQTSSSHSRTPSPVPAPLAPAAPIPLIRALKRRSSMTMPGSLFPRSLSMEPEFRPERDHRVRFTSSGLRPSSSPSPATPPPDSSCQTSDAPLPVSVHPRESSSSGSPSTPRRTRTNVQSAANKFHIGAEDTGPSILLPSPHTSPTAYGATHSTGVDKGKARAFDDTHEGDTSGVLRVRGKEQELFAARKELDRHQRLLAGDQDDAEGETSVLRQVERDRDRDKARILMLEEEIARLKQELSQRPTTTTNASTPYPYPPPPPPPPPPPFPLPRKTIINVPSTSDDPNLFASARASLKQAPPPVENPIVPMRRAGIATLGLAPDKMAAFLNEMKTVRLRKTVGGAAPSGGRSVHDNGNATFVAPTPPSRVAQLAPRRSLEGLHQHRPLMDEDVPMAPEEWTALRARVRAEMDDAGGQAGEKRKRSENVTALAEDLRSGPVKRFSTIRTSTDAASAHSSFASTSTSTSGSSSYAPRGLPRRTSTPLSSFSQPAQSQSETQTETQSQASPPSPPSPVRSAIPPAATAWQTSSVTDAPTPSLCSDNENLNDGERGADGWATGRQDDDDDQVLVTPPIGVGGGSGPSRSFFRFKGNGIPVEETERVMDKSISNGRAMDRSMNRSMNTSMNTSLNRSMNTSTRAVGDMGRTITSRPARTASAPGLTSAPANARQKATGIPRLKARPLSRPRAHSPSAAAATPPALRQEDDNEEEHGEGRPSTFIRARDVAPRANIAFFAGRAPSSPMPKSPRRPRAPGRVALRGGAAGSASGSGIGTSVGYGAPGYTPGIRRVADVTVERYEEEEDQMEEEEEEGHDERSSFLLSVPPFPERTPSPTDIRRGPSGIRAPAQSQSQRQSKNHSQSQQKQPKSKADPKPKLTLKRRLTLDDELRSAVPFLHEDAADEEDVDIADAHVDPSDAYMAEVAQQDADEVQDAPQDLDSGVLVGVGTRSKQRGFLAHGGAGGTPVFMGVGYVEGAEEDEAQEAGVGDDDFEDRDGSEYADEAQDGDYDAGDNDDDEYLPSPAPRARQAKSQRRR